MAESVEPGFYEGVKALNVSIISYSSLRHTKTILGSYVRRHRCQYSSASGSRWEGSLMLIQLERLYMGLGCKLRGLDGFSGDDQVKTAPLGCVSTWRMLGCSWSGHWVYNCTRVFGLVISFCGMRT
jgi:hypothetical protein